jgi:hypothetical protein
MNVCALTSGEDEQLFANNPAQVRNYSKPIKQNQNENFDINEYKSDSESSAKKISFKDIKFRKSSKVVNSILIVILIALLLILCMYLIQMNLLVVLIICHLI